MSKIECRVPVQLDRADSKVRATEIDCKVESLNVVNDLLKLISSAIHTFSVPLGTAVTYVGIWLMVEAFFDSPSSVIDGKPRPIAPRHGIAHTHLKNKALNTLADLLVRVLELRRHAFRFLEERHCVRSGYGRLGWEGMWDFTNWLVDKVDRGRVCSRGECLGSPLEEIGTVADEKLHNLFPS